MFGPTTRRRSVRSGNSSGRSSSHRTLLHAARRLGIELLEARRLLSIESPQIELFSTSPALFVENQGQWPDPSVRYAFQGSGANVLFTDTGPVFQVLRREVAQQAEPLDGVAHRADPPARLAEHEETATRSAQFSVTFDGGNLVEPAGLDRAETVYNYYVGDQSRWRSEVPTYETVAYRGLYEGIDLLTWGRRDSLKYEFHVAPGADWGQVRIRYEGIDGLVLDPLGNLHVQTSVGELVDDAPRVFQEIGGRQIDVPARFELVDARSCRFVLTGDYDPSVELVIDPDLAWGTFVGGSSDDEGYGIAVDGDGNALVTGYTYSVNFAGANNSGHGYGDAFVAKVSSGGSLAWATYLGGGSVDWGFGIAVDGDGNALVTGYTQSSDFAGANNSIQYWDAFVAKVTRGGVLAWATYLGGSNGDTGYGIAVDGAGNALVTGYTYSSNFAGANNSHHGGSIDAFVAKVTPGGVLAWATYLGGSDEEIGLGIAVEGDGNALVTGYTQSWDFAGANNSHQGGSSADAFVAKVTSGGVLARATYLGGSHYDYGFGIAVDGAGNALVTGWTQSSDFAGASNSLHGGYSDAFVAKVTSGGLLAWTTYLGGSGDEEYGRGIAVDGGGNALVTGYTNSTNFAGADNSYHGGYYDAFVAKVTPGGALARATYLGGDHGYGIAVDGDGNALVTGSTNSDFAGANNSPHGGWFEAFVAKVRIQEVVDLGTVDYRDLPGLDPSVADVWWRFQTTRAGFVSARAALPPDATGDISVTLFDVQWNELISAGATAGAAQADWQAAAGGQTYFVRLSGNVGNVDLRLANLVRRTGSVVAVAGTAAQDLFQCVAAPARHVTINGLTYPFDPAAVSMITFDGGGGPDSALVSDSTGDANADLEPGAALVRDTAAGVSVYVTRTGSITVDGGGGESSAWLYDSPGDDTFTGRPGHCVLSGEDFFLGAVGFRYVLAYAAAGGQDTAVLDDSPGNDVFTADPVRHYAVLYGATFYHRVDSFDRVEANSAAGIDIAKLYDSAGNDTFVADATSARLSGDGFSNQANKFRYVIGFGSSGTDTAIVNGSAETDTFVGTPTYAVLSGAAYTDRVSSFDTVTANGTPGGADVARLYDSAGDDTFVAYPTEATLSGPGYSNRATDFRYVHAYSTTGGTDTATFYDSSGADTFVAYPSYGALYGTNFYNRANYFDSVVGHSSAGADLAKLYDSAGDDTFDAYLAYAVLSGAGFSNRVDAFPYVTAYSDAGGTDTANLHGSPGDETITGTYEYTRMQGGATDITARAFEKTYVLTGSGGNDKATLYDSSGDDRLDAAGNWAKLSYPDRFIHLSDLTALARVKAMSSKGGTDTRHTEATDYVLETQGPWTPI